MCVSQTEEEPVLEDLELVTEEPVVEVSPDVQTTRVFLLSLKPGIMQTKLSMK